MFDVTIVTQSFIYKPKYKRRHARSRSNTAIVEAGVEVEEERAGLLAGDALAGHRLHHHHSHSLSHPHLYTPHTSGADSSLITGSDAVTRGRTTQIARSVSD